VHFALGFAVVYVIIELISSTHFNVFVAGMSARSHVLTTQMSAGKSALASETVVADSGSGRLVCAEN
jgi:hypothetical protein